MESKVAKYLSAMAIALLVVVSPLVSADDPAVVAREFVYEDAPFPQCHAATIEATPTGLVAAWFGGTREKDPDVGIWVSRKLNGEEWSVPVEVANGVQYTLTDGTVVRHPTWNPVLFQYPAGPLHLYFKAGPSPSTWWGMLTVSDDGGLTWSVPRRLPEHIDGPVRNKPILLNTGVLLCGSSTENDGWRLHFEQTSDFGVTYTRTLAINDGKTFGAIQPTLLRHKGGAIQALARNQDGNGKVLTTWSEDNGATWPKLSEHNLPNPNSGIDAVSLQDGRFLLVYNHTNRSGDTPRGREMLNVAISEDGFNWKAAMTLENELKSEFSYPAVIQASDGTIHVVYTWKRQKVRHVVLDPKAIRSVAFVDEKWPLGQ